MEPSLKDGDILLIRKADFPIFRWYGPTHKKNSEDDNIFAKISNYDNDDGDNNLDDVSGPLMRSRRLREYEYQHHLAQHDAAVWWRCPPWPLRGQIVTYRSPYKYPPELCIKRVVGIAGQVVRNICIRPVVNITMH